MATRERFLEVLADPEAIRGISAAIRRLSKALSHKHSYGRNGWLLLTIQGQPVAMQRCNGCPEYRIEGGYLSKDRR